MNKNAYLFTHIPTISHDISMICHDMRIFHSIAPRWAVLDLFIVVSSWWEVFVEAWCHGSNYRDLGRFPKRLVSGISWGPLGNQLKMLGYNQLI